MWIGKTDTEYRYELKNGTLYLEFRGTTSREDWWQNFRFWARPYKNMADYKKPHGVQGVGV